MQKPTISYCDFAKLDLRVGTIVGVTPTRLVSTQVLVLANLEPKKMMGLESQGMILMAVGGNEREAGEQKDKKKKKK